MQTCKILILLLAISPQNKTTTQKVHFICKLNCRTSPAKTAKVKQLAIIFFLLSSLFAAEKFTD